MPSAKRKYVDLLAKYLWIVSIEDLHYDLFKHVSFNI